MLGDVQAEGGSVKTLVIQDSGQPPERPASTGGEGRVPESGGGHLGPIRRHPLPAFFLLAFALTWCIVPFGSFMAGGPLLAALIVTAIVGGRTGLRELGSRMIRWRIGWQWYVVAIVVPLAVALGSGALTVALGGPGSAFRELEVSALVLLFATRLVVPIFSPMGEEPGWRGFALPRMLADRTPFVATLVLGVIVAVWHVPLIFIASEDLPAIGLLGTVAVTFWYSWLFIHTGGSVLITIVAHAADGLVGRSLTDDGFAGVDERNFNLLYSAAWCIVALSLLALDWKLWRAPIRRLADRVTASPALDGAR
jgi:uncharacterized protein